MSERESFPMATAAFAGAALWAALAMGCAGQPGEVLRTPEQWRADVQTQMQPLLPALRKCFDDTAAERAPLPPGGRSKMAIRIQVDSADHGARAKVRVFPWLDAATPREEQVPLHSKLDPCIHEVVKTMKVPPKLDTNTGDGTWSFVFVGEPAGGSGASPR